MMKRIKRLAAALLLSISCSNIQAIDHPGITGVQLTSSRFTLIENGQPTPVLISADEDAGVIRATKSLQADFERVCGKQNEILTSSRARIIIIGTLQSSIIRQLVKSKAIDERELKGKREKYVMKTVKNPMKGVDEALVIAGSDKRGTIYGIYELSEQIGVSPWYYWADVPVAKHQNLAIEQGSYTAGEPAVRYRGIFLNDEAPCLTSWVKNTFGTDFGGHLFYEKVFELLLRLRANFLWPAMWGWAFYADDAKNSDTANEMGIIMGTSHHEPMARNHQEWARHRGQFGAWDYSTNKEVLDKFFREGMSRAKNTEDLITIGMRGDGDTAMGVKEGEQESTDNDKKVIALLENIIENQRRIIKEETGRPAKDRPQVWALYKEVQRYYELGLRVPDDVTILISDDNWGDVRHLPNAEERKRSGGWGMYYHVDYVGAPRNSKWLNVTPIQNLWEQMSLTYQFGVDRLWVLNVGDLKPMEYPITLFLDMAWNPTRYTAENLLDHPKNYCAQQFGEPYAEEAARILNLYSKYNGRCTPELLDKNTYDLASGEWLQVVNEYKSLEADAMRLYHALPAETHDAYQQIILFPVQAMSNLYEMYYAQAMNHECYAKAQTATAQKKALVGEANRWANLVASTFKRDSILCANYNHKIAGGKWNGMMTQKHIGYTNWNDNFPADRMPIVYKLAIADNGELTETQMPAAQQGNGRRGGFGGGFGGPAAKPKVTTMTTDSPVFKANEGCLSIEAEHYYKAQGNSEAQWTVIPYMGRTLSGVALMPYTARTDSAMLTYCMQLPEDVKEVTVHIITKSTLAFQRAEGHRYQVGFKGAEMQTINYNGNLNEDPKNQYSVYYPTVARRVVEKEVKLPVTRDADGNSYLQFSPIEPAVVLEKIVVDWGGYRRQYLFGKENTMK